MSSILKALKKLEKESPKTDEDKWPKKIDPWKGMPYRFKIPKHVNHRLIVCLSLLALCVGGWLLTNRLFFSKKPLSEERIVTTKVNHTDYEESTHTASEESHHADFALKNEDVKTASTFQPATKKESIDKKTNIQTEWFADDSNYNEEPEPAFQRRGNKIKQLRENINKPRMTKSEERRSKYKINKSHMIEKKVVDYDTEPAISGEETDPSNTLEKYDDSRLQLQAIAWDPDPKNRIAVISGRIVREGSFIENIKITHIDMNHISFQDGNKEWKQKFRD